MAPTPALIAALALAVVLAGCTSNAPPAGSSAAPTSPSPTTNSSAPPTSSTPTPTWAVEQAAAILAVDDYWAAIGRIELNPAGFNESEMRAVLEKVAGGEVIAANVRSYLDLKKHGYRYDGTTSAISTKATDPSTASFGVEVVVTRCVDQRNLRVVDKSGKEVDESALGYRVPDFNLRQYTVVKRTGSAKFLIYGLAPAKGECGA